MSGGGQRADSPALQQAQACHRAGQEHDAERLYRQALPHPGAWHGLGILLAQNGRLDDALPLLKRALEGDPSRVQYWVAYAEALWAGGQRDQARNVLERGRSLGISSSLIDGVLARLNADGSAPVGVDAASLYRSALEHHQAGRFAEAAKLYARVAAARPGMAEPHGNLGSALRSLGDIAGAQQAYRQAIVLKPDYAGAHYNLANLLKDQGDAAGALAHYRQAAAADPALAGAHNNLGTLLLDRGAVAEAVQSYRRALDARPDFPEAHSNLGNALKALGQADEALASYEKAVSLRPDYAEAWNNKGTLLLEKERAAEAMDCFRKALALKPGYAEAHNNLGNALMQQKDGGRAAAIAEYRRAIASDPDYIAAYHHLGLALWETHRIAEGCAAFTQGAARTPPAGPPFLPHKVQHDDEQRAYLSRAGIAADAGGPLHLDGGTALPGHVIKARGRAAEIERQWTTARPQILVVDDLLTPEALAELRRFCLGSAIWRETFDDGYLGARPESGFACPLLAQVAGQLRQSFPGVFRDHPLLYAWSFKYDQALKGTQIHADFAAVNVNFWITPDDANADPETGGLVVWDKTAPLDWDFERYNRDETAIREFLGQSAARSVRIPHRANRAVIFDSDLFHETDRMQFRGGYENRRINITLLYGRRSAQT